MKREGLVGKTAETLLLYKGQTHGGRQTARGKEQELDANWKG